LINQTKKKRITWRALKFLTSTSTVAAALKSFQLLRIVVMLPLGISDEVIEACFYPFFCIL